MRITPRGNEVEAVVAILESEEFDSATDMAKAIVQAVATELSNRTTTGIKARFKGDSVWDMAVGPFYHDADVRKWLQEAQEAGLEARTARLSSPACLKPPEALREACVCGHQKEQHVVYGRKGKETAPRDCGVCPTGTCKAFTQEGK